MNIPENVLAPIVCFGFMALFAGVIVWMVRTERKRKLVKAEQAGQLGFSAVPKPDQALVDRIFNLFALRGRRLNLRNVFFRRSTDYDLYLFDLLDTSGEDSSQLVESGVAIISPRLRLPRLALISRLEGTGFLVNAANSLIGRLVAGQNQIAFPEDPEFDSHFWVTGPDEAAARAFLTRDRKERICHLKNVQIQMGGDTLALSCSTPNTGRQRVAPLEVINQTLRDAQSLATWLME